MWQGAIYIIAFTNTMKMKFSVIIGIIQMLFGLSLSLLNHLYFKRKLNILLEFIPQILFMTLIFVYLCFMIFIKWIKYNGSPSPTTGSCAPNLLIGNESFFILSPYMFKKWRSYEGFLVSKVHQFFQ